MIPREQHLRLAQREGHVVCSMSRSSDRFHGPAGALDDVPLREPTVGPELDIVARLEPCALADIELARGAMRPFPEHDRPRCRLDASSGRGVVAVGMGDEDMRHGLAAYCFQQGADVMLVEWTRIYDGNATATDDV